VTAPVRLAKTGTPAASVSNGAKPKDSWREGCMTKSYVLTKSLKELIRPKKWKLCLLNSSNGTASGRAPVKSH
jgi:hypothetical protein